jgi:hypothetical protein
MADLPDWVNDVGQEPNAANPDQIADCTGGADFCPPATYQVYLFPIPNDGYWYALDKFIFIIFGYSALGGLSGVCDVGGGYSEAQDGSNPVWICEAATDSGKELQPCCTMRPRFAYPRSWLMFIGNDSADYITWEFAITYYKYRIQ